MTRNPLHRQRYIHIVILLILMQIPGASAARALSAAPEPTASPFALTPLISGNLHKPIFLTHTQEDDGRLFVVEQDGKVLIVKNGQLLPTPFLDISNTVSTGGERGLLGLAFHPHYRKNGRFFINYTRKADQATVIAEYRRAANPDQAESEKKVLLVMAQPYGNHNGGMVAFGHDGYLYIGMGDGGAGGDPENRAQNPNTLLGKILRIDIDQGDRYSIPADNPFVKHGGRPEIYATGLRNPWRFSFDRQTGELWAGDVGQNAWEEVTKIKKGENHGWRLMEGQHCFQPRQGCQHSQQLTLPVLDYPNGENGRCSVTGGYVYRGKAIPALQGTYLFADFCSGEIFRYANGSFNVLLDTDLQIPSFGEDESGELYVLGYAGSVQKLTPVRHLP
ncbi:MAG: glucose dehydrogenase [Nitrospirales bacterium]|nr:MAG: glucose dehydrogenase [Nitrospirales bacterium]